MAATDQGNPGTDKHLNLENSQVDDKREQQQEGRNSILEKILEGYFIQELEDQSAIRKEYYFDSFDVINILMGGWKYEVKTKFDKVSLHKDSNEEQINFTYAFAYSGMYNTINLLPPHEIELYNKLENSKYLFREKIAQEDYKRLVREVLFGLAIIDEKQRSSFDTNNIQEYVWEFVKKGEDLFIANYLLRHYNWAGRFKYLTEEKKYVRINSVSGKLDKIDDMNLFMTIKKGFDEVRESHSTNNFYDALAFYQLQKKLDRHINNSSQYALPVFFASAPTMQKAIEKIRKRRPELFVYKSEDGRGIPIVRDSLYFILDPIFSANDSDKENPFFNNFQESKDDLKEMVKKSYQQSFHNEHGLVHGLQEALEKFKKSVKEIISLKFIQEIWIKQKQYQNLIDEIREDVNWKEKNDRQIKKLVNEYLKNTLKEADQSLQESKKLNDIFSAFNIKMADITKIFDETHPIELDVFRDFALMKFGVDRRKLPDLTDRISNMLQFAPDEPDQLPETILWVMQTLTLEPKSVNDSSSQFLEAIIMAWLLNRQSLIVKLYEKYYQKYGREEVMEHRYELPLIYAAAKIATDNGAGGRKETLRIIECVLEKVENNYKVWIGIAYLYFRLWESITQLSPTLPELNEEAWMRQRKDIFYKKYLTRGAFYYIDKTLKYFRDEYKSSNPEGLRLQYYLYALNNKIYYTTKCGSKEKFSALENLIEPMMNHEHWGDWQARYYDTVGWYFLRKSLLTKNNKTVTSYLDLADKYANYTDSKNVMPKDKPIYGRLNRAILRVKETMENE